MTPDDEGADRVGHGEAGLGEAQSSNPPDDPEMIRDDASPLDADVEYEGEGEPPDEPRDNEDPAPNAPGAEPSDDGPHDARAAAARRPRRRGRPRGRREVLHRALPRAGAQRVAQ